MFLPFCCVFKGQRLATLQPGNGLPTCLLYGSKLNRFTDQSFTSAGSPKGVFLNSPPRLCLRLGQGLRVKALCIGGRISERVAVSSIPQRRTWHRHIHGRRWFSHRLIYGQSTQRLQGGRMVRCKKRHCRNPWYWLLSLLEYWCCSYFYLSAFSALSPESLRGYGSLVFLFSLVYLYIMHIPYKTGNKIKKKKHFFKSLSANKLQRAIFFLWFLACGILPHLDFQPWPFATGHLGHCATLF